MSSFRFASAMPRRATLLLGTLALAGCGGRQSILSPAGTDAATLATLFWVMLVGAVVVWLLMNGLMLYVWRINVGEMSSRKAEAVIIGGGVVFPTVVIGALLAYALSTMPEMREPGDGLEVRVTGEQWWWRVDYWPEGADAPIVSANEIVLPAGSRSEIALTSDRVIHSFWIPSLGGKTDMFPGRETRMSLEPTVPGEYRGQCTEYCGESHAWMAFDTRVLSPEDFDAWLEAEAAPAKAPEGEPATRGQAVFLSEGCGACHVVRGTPASGRVGPDLTHVGARSTLAAGALPVSAEAFADWVRAPEAIKPGARMPAYDHLTDAELSDLAAYLEGLT